MTDSRSWGPPMRMLEIFTSVDTFKEKKEILGKIWLFLIKKGVDCIIVQYKEYYFEIIFSIYQIMIYL